LPNALDQFVFGIRDAAGDAAKNRNKLKEQRKLQESRERLTVDDSAFFRMFATLNLHSFR
jgi:hypothetical protein